MQGAVRKMASGLACSVVGQIGAAAAPARARMEHEVLVRAAVAGEISGACHVADRSVLLN
jgi:hypothetical protein